ncbi:DNA repair protein RadA [Marinitoga sp. 1135]|uniref:DNA repair protein RadA n=1 Tax=Marinitoga piezophila (strain DSM 14283 / JCM 11233 / KA3) TaxID=443254 RepID=H2J5I6_MARPK|nr:MULTISPECIES: DNA repair protein RadA [Marinitoga]AEX86130.1 DNA repair protein RadA [Marinitoga piezophila KA3]APT76545.1 DNA repair protein RadA [Marinitoga sp. 1137]NUU96314.1 DNA repair protein RadA [Marinitoga sp. 1135]NUU98232.1 DNA repair protein RadA [Marinitoga sp. 1138]
MSKKRQNYFVCSNCGYESTKWFAKCPSCNEWNTAVEFTADLFDDKANINIKTEPTELLFLDDEINEPEKLKTGFKELDEVLNGGFVESGVYLLAGEPGIGKSTLLTQISSSVGSENMVIYVSGEESAEQVFQRFKRLGIKKDGSKIGLIFENSLERIISVIEKLEEKPTMLIIDSIQTLKSENFSSFAGSILQVKEVTRYLSEYCKKKGITLIIVGHVTKGGIIAGPKVLEHMVDAVLQFELEKTSGLRMLRILKNRYGPTDELLMFEMTQKGLIPISEYTNYFLKDYKTASGNVLTIVKEGSKLIPIEIQALVSKPVYGNPRRVTSGAPLDRLLMIIAVLSKRLRLPIESKDIFLSTSGGFKISDTSSDLAIAYALLSSLFDISTGGSIVVMGEIGLDGNIRNINNLEKRIEFSKKLGIDYIVIPNSKKIKNNEHIKISNLSELVKRFFA